MATLRVKERTWWWQLNRGKNLGSIVSTICFPKIFKPSAYGILPTLGFITFSTLWLTLTLGSYHHARSHETPPSCFHEARAPSRAKTARVILAPLDSSLAKWQLTMWWFVQKKGLGSRMKSNRNVWIASSFRAEQTGEDAEQNWVLIRYRHLRVHLF